MTVRCFCYNLIWWMFMSMRFLPKLGLILKVSLCLGRRDNKTEKGIIGGGCPPPLPLSVRFDNITVECNLVKFVGVKLE
jgi:hypothetical protein